MAGTIVTAFKNWLIGGAGTPGYEPVKADGIAAAGVIQATVDLISAGVVVGSAVVYASVSARTADTTQDDGTLGVAVSGTGAGIAYWDDSETEWVDAGFTLAASALADIAAAEADILALDGRLDTAEAAIATKASTASLASEVSDLEAADEAIRDTPVPPSSLAANWRQWSNETSGDPNAKESVDSALVTTGLDGKVLRVSTEDTWGPKWHFPCEPGEVSLVKGRFRRHVAPGDPSGHAVRLYVQWLNASGVPMAVAPQMLAESLEPEPADGLIILSGYVGGGGEDGVTQWPVGAVDFTAYLHTYGTDHETDLVSVEVTDVTGLYVLDESVAATIADVVDGTTPVAKANTLTTPRAIAITGDVTGSANFDGSAGISITATVVDDSHAHVISNVDGLQDALDAKAATADLGDLATKDTVANSDMATMAESRIKGRAASAGTGAPVDLTPSQVRTLINVADGATANASDADLRARSSHTGTQSADTLTDGTTNKAFLATERTKLDGIEAGAQVNTVASVAGKTGTVSLVKGDVGLGNVDNTADASKPISTATQTALDAKAPLAPITSLVAGTKGGALSPEFLTTSLTGKPAAVSSITGTSGVAIVDDADIGAAVQITNVPLIVAQRETTPIREDRVYRFSMPKLKRVIAPADPNGDAVQWGVRFLTETHTGVAGGNGNYAIANDDLDLGTDGAVMNEPGSTTFALGTVEGVNREIPAGTFYARAWIRVYGTDHTTLIGGTIYLEDITDQFFGGSEAAELAASKADKAITITGGGLATGGGTLEANRVLTVTEASDLEATTGTSGTVAMTPRRTKTAIDVEVARATAAEGVLTAAVEAEEERAIDEEERIEGKVDTEIADRTELIQSGTRGGRYEVVFWDRETGEVLSGFRPGGQYDVVALGISDIMSMKPMRGGDYAQIDYDTATGRIVGGLTNAGIRRNLGIDLADVARYRAMRVPGSPALIEYSLETGYIRARIEQDGTRNDISASDGGVTTTTSLTGGILAERYHFAALTQSWGGGTQGNPPLTTDPQDRVVMPAGGIRFNENGVSDPLDSLIPAFEQLRPDTNRGETPWSSWAQAFIQRAVADADIVDTGLDVGLTAVTPGGETIDGVSPGSSNWTAWQNGVTAMFNLTVAAGKTYRLAGIPMMIGKGDYDAIDEASGTEQPDRTVYKDKILAIVEAANTFIRTLDPLHPDVYLYWYQTLSHVHNGEGRFPDPIIDWAAVDASIEDPRVVVIAPMWAYADADDSVHYPALSYQGMGAAGGVAAYRHLILADPEAGRPGLPESIIRQGNTVIVWYPASVGPLTFDTTNVANPGDYGCRLYDAGTGTYLTLASAPTIIAGRGVKMVATTTVPPTCRYRTGGDDVIGGGVGNVNGFRCCLRRAEAIDVEVGELTAVARPWAISIDVAIP